MSGPYQPTPTVWPRCSECDVDYVLRRCFVFNGRTGYDWLWQRDCKHKKADAAIVDADGLVPS